MLLSVVFFAPALAEEPTFEGTAPPATFDEPETHVTANVGGNFTAGNAESVNFNAGLAADRKWMRNQFGVVGGAAIAFGAIDANGDGFLASSERCIGVAGGECSPTAQRYFLDARYDRFISDRGSLYLLAGGYHDKFAGFDLRVHAQLGYARHLIDTDLTHLKVEAGIDVANENYVDGVEPGATKLIAAQLAAELTHTFNENVSFANTLTLYEPILTQPDGSPFAPYFSDLRLSNVASINAKMSDRFSISVSDALSWRNEPVSAPEGITEKRSAFDNTLSVALVASLL